MRCLVIGSHLRREAPILAHRLRKAARRGAQVSFLNPARFTYLFPVKSYLVAGAADLVGNLAAVLAAAAQAAGKSVPAHLAGIANGASVTDEHRAIAQSLLAGAEAGGVAGRTCRRAMRALPTCARWPPAWRRSPAPRSGASPRAATPPARTWPGRSRIARRATLP